MTTLNPQDFTFSDLIAGYVTSFDSARDRFTLKTTDGREYEVTLTPTLFAEVVRNLGEEFHNATESVREMLTEGRYLFVYGVFYPDDRQAARTFEAKHIVFVGEQPEEYRFEEQDWWIAQVRQLADFYLTSEFGDGEIDFEGYRTNLSIGGDKARSGRQETDTISRLVYGFASAFLMTGEDRYLEAAEKGTEYLRKHHRFRDDEADTTYWYHAVDIKSDGSRHKVFASEFGDDYHAIPCYEQIYALAGPTQTYRITGERAILEDARATIRTFNEYFCDKSENGGFYSHIDPLTLRADAESLKQNRAKKNWNSVGDHAPAYLINLYLATGDKEYADFLEYNFDLITRHFPDYDESPFVQERFFQDWSKDQSWGWQQNRAVVGHNLKIAWNLMRMNSLRQKESYAEMARRIAELMPAAGSDQQRGGWYDVVERKREPGQRFHRLVWHDRKAWWQQEQAILAYLILAGVTADRQYHRLARESAAFYNAWFLDTDAGGVYFNVLANGMPYALGTERGKGSHSMAGYHSFELAYLAAVYTNLLVTKKPMDFYFKPRANQLPDGKLRVAPDLLPAGSVRIGEVWVDGQKHENFDADELVVTLPPGQEQAKVRVRLVPAGVTFSADLLQVIGNEATIALSGRLEGSAMPTLLSQLQNAQRAGATSISLEAVDLDSVCNEALRALAIELKDFGPDFTLGIVHANEGVRQALQTSGLDDEIAVHELALA